MRIWVQRGACAIIIGAGFIVRLPLGLDTARQSIFHRVADTDVYIEQPPRRALEKTDAGPAGKDGGNGLKPAEGPALPTSKQPEVCGPQNAPSQACYTATQQAHPVPR